MTGWPSSAPRGGVSRRRFLGLASAAVGLWVRPAWPVPGGGDARARGPGDHLPVLRVPRVPANGNKIPIVVEMDHPMTPEHHVTTVRVTNERDPISAKGTFHFTPANGRVYLSFQARMHEGRSEVTASARCNRHGTSSSREPIEIAAGESGCAAAGPAPVLRPGGDDIRGPVVRIPAVVERGRVDRGEIIHVGVKMRHPSRTGLVFRDGVFVQESEPLHLDEMEVRYGGETVSRFTMTSALSDDPFITFALRAEHDGPITVVLRNNLGQVFEATHELRLA